MKFSSKTLKGRAKKQYWTYNCRKIRARNCSKQETKQNLKKSLWSKLLELRKTRTKKSTPDMFNFYVVSAGHDTVTAVSRASIFRINFNYPSLQIKSTKKEGSSENMGFNGKTVWRFQTEKKNRNNNLDLSEKTQRKTKSPASINRSWPSWTVRVKLEKTWKETGGLWKPLELCKTWTKKSSFDMVHFYVISAGRDMVNDTDSSTTCRSKFKAPPKKKQNYKMWSSFGKHWLHQITVWRFHAKNSKI